jgi:biuret amidohydrolase
MTKTPAVVFGVEYFSLELPTTALIIIDMQNGFVLKGEPYTAYPMSLRIIPKIEKILSFARKYSMPVFWTLCDHGYPGGGLLLRKFPAIAKEKVFWLNTNSFKLHRGLSPPQADERQIIKHKYNAFFGTDLEITLRDLGIKTLIITGISTDVCCESTTRAAFEREIQVAFVADATATRSEQAQKSTLDRIGKYFGRVLTTAELLKELSNQVDRKARNQNSLI